MSDLWNMSLVRRDETHHESTAFSLLTMILISTTISGIDVYNIDT